MFEQIGLFFDEHSAALVTAGILLGSALATFLVARFVALPLVRGILRRAPGTFSETVLQRRVLHVLAWLGPVLVIHAGLASFAAEIRDVGRQITGALLVLLFVVLASRLLGSAHDVYRTTPLAQKRPIKGYVQLARLFLYIIGAMLAVFTLLDVSPWALLSGIGAVTAVLLLIFKDTILSLVASIQIAAYDLVQEGDWVEAPKYGANGAVIDMSLHTVKVQNWDNTIVSIPTYKLIDDSFKNYRGMFEAGGRRIMRAVNVDQTSVRFLEADELERLARIELIRDYVTSRRTEIEEFNAAHGLDRSVSPVNGRAMTNLGTFRAYIRAYLDYHPRIRDDMMLMVRQLEPSADRGLPLEIYCFTDTTVWAEYELVQADIFDHILAAMPEFGLRAYQRVGQGDERAGGLIGAGQGAP